MRINQTSKFITFDKAVLFFFILCNIGLYYEEYSLLHKIAYLLLAVAAFRKIALNNKLISYKFFLLSVLFVLLSFFSGLWSYNYDYTMQMLSILAKSVILSILLLCLLNSRDNVLFSLYMLAISGIVYAIIYMSFFNLTLLGAHRFSNLETDIVNEYLPNVNLVATYVSMSFAFFLYSYLLQKKKLNIFLAGLSLILVILLGSRKSIINVVLAFALVWPRIRLKNKIHFLFFIVLLIIIIMNFVPNDYMNYIFSRFTYFSSSSFLQDADQQRYDMLSYGVDYISQHPLLGQGYYNFAYLFQRDKGLWLYSHNNFIEIAVGVGAIGLFIYYAIYYNIFKNLKITKGVFDYNYLLMALAVLNLVNHFTIVLMDNRFNWILITILFASSEFAKAGKRKSLNYCKDIKGV